MNYKKLWIAFSLVVGLSFLVLGYFGYEIYMQAPPIPQEVKSEHGKVLFNKQDIQEGQSVWQSIGGQEVGSIWGHGAYVAPDWSADFLHRELVIILDNWAIKEGVKGFSELPGEKQAALKERLRKLIRTNKYDPNTKVLTLSNEEVEAINEVSKHYSALFMGDESMHKLRDAYALQPHAVKDPTKMKQMVAFFYWTSWACSTNRPKGEVTYTNNWPAEALIANAPSGSIIVWSVFSFVFLLAGIGALSWYFAAERSKESELSHHIPSSDPLLGLKPTPSMQATLKYFWTAGALLVVQVGLGAITAHYGVEGSGFYGIPLSEWLPYAVTRTWHTQLGIFWIATTWLATGLFIAPAVSGYEPKFQRAGVNLLFICLVIIVVGSMAGQWLGVQQKMGLETNFWFGHQGYEYVDLGRFWQIFLFAGLFIWLGLMARALTPAFKKPEENKSLLSLFLIASIAIAVFYGAGLLYGRHTNLAIAEYWRWWVVHLWVEGFFEVFATVVIAFLFTRMGLLEHKTATASVLFSTIIFLGGGIIGTMHHLYFTGTPTPVLAWGATFSALEVVPLTLIGFEAYGNMTLSQAQPWVKAYHWPINFFVSVAFWNMVGAGIFGFLINPPIALYYMQGLNTTAVHGHTALFGVYGMLAIGLMLFCLKGLAARTIWKTGAVSFAFWAINIGLALMVLISLLPVGLLQTWASVENGLWYARSAEFMQTPVMNTLKWLRVIGDTIFAIGVFVLGWFVLGLKTGWSVSGQVDPDMPMIEPSDT
ncbi:MAG: nitric-oxide reductase large subunit [Candidatus Melainabacteria bacterium]|nr:nitric-oxide reductase large subunit [Candidatus Melainabacteria bacterium]